MNVNAAAIALTGVVALGGLSTTYLWKSFMRDQLLHANNYDHNHFSYGRQFGKWKARIFFYQSFCFQWLLFSFFFIDEFDEGNIFTKISEKIGKSLGKYDIDLKVCLQKFVCTLTRDAAKNVAKGRGSSTEKIIDGITRWDQMHYLFRSNLRSISNFCSAHPY